MRTLTLALAALALAAPACSDDGGGDPGTPPALIPGGGVHDPGIDGVVNVYVIDADSDQPIAGASVRVGDVELATDATGLATVTGVTGPQTVLAKATAHATAAWVGVDGANVTIPLDRSPPDSSRPPQAQLTGSIEGWMTQPNPASDRVIIGLVTYAQDPELGARANQIAQPPSMGTLPPSACVRTAGPATACNWKLNARPGDIALGLTMIEIDTRGTADPSDDATAVTGFAVRPITVVAGENQTGVMMPAAAVDSGVRPTADLGTPPAELPQVGAQIGLDLGARGVFRVPLVDPTRGGAKVPSLAIAAGASYELIGVARETGGDAFAADSIVIRRGQTDPEALTVGPWLRPPGAIATDRTMVSFTRSGTGALHVVELTNAGLGVEGRPVMSIAIFDGSAQVALPTAFSPLPADPMTLKVTALDVGGADLRDFEVDALTAGLTAAASDTIAVP
jgi:hypothetical protein